MNASEETMVGREAERDRLSGFLSADDGGALVIRGETGVGKSRLLDHGAAVGVRQGYRCVRAVGVEAEWGLPFAGLHQLLHPLLSTHGAEHRHREVLDVVFGRAPGESPSLMALGVAVLELLTAAAARTPLLLVIDDGQWFDVPSADVCCFVGRRLTAKSVKMVMALRSDAESRFDTTGLPELLVPPLANDEAQRLLDARHPHLDTDTRRVVLDHAQGNPLALLELPHCVAAVRGDGGEDPLGFRGIPLSRRLEHVYGRRISALDAQIRAELLRGALDGAGSGPEQQLGLRARYRMRQVEDAVAQGLLSVDQAGGGLAFRHPLVRSALVHLATPEERRAAHAELARVHRDDIERRAGHLAAATVDPDDEVAAVLDQAARSATRRGGAATAVAWLTRAAELSERPADRARRLGDAAFIAGHAALLDRAQRLVDTTGRTAGATESSALAVTSSYVDLYRGGDVRSTHLRVLSALESLREHGGPESEEVFVRLLDLLLAISQYAGDRTTWERTERLFESVEERVPALTALYRDTWSDVVRHGAGVRQRVERGFADVADLQPWDVARLAVSAYHVDVLWQYRPYLQRVVDREKGSGAVANVMTMLHLVMLDQIATGEWREAELTGQRVLELTRAHGYELFAHQSRAYLGLLAATRGERERAEELRVAVDTWARPRGVAFLAHLAEAIGAAAALSAADYEAAYLHATGITAPGTFEPYAQQATRTLLDLVEAAVRTGRLRQARRHALAARDAHLPDISPRLALVTFGALAMTAADDKEADEHFARAVAHPAAATFPFELARIRLAHGTRLRRTRGPRAAREVLVRAAEAFGRLGAVTWAERTQIELRASGTPIRLAPSCPETLTWQERRIADLAARGLTNREIAERMLLSPRTVGSHLYHIFPKLGITSRAALRDALGRIDAEENASP